uniref:G-protein coupled receptors family 1 profile domain-containing protein n=1 Tax=Panagrolaimus sp. ES5 TaxID=591445 RepID=A0AC34F3S6_9BILA
MNVIINESFHLHETPHIAAVAETNDGFTLWQLILIGFLILTLIVFCVVGNLFVILAVLLERDLRSRPQYYLIFSLAIADLLVGLIVTPLGAWSTLSQEWSLGVTLCDFWVSVDVLVCTSSILHLVAIALDRAAKKRFRRDRDRRTINRTFEGSVKNNKAILQKNTQVQIPPTVVFSQDMTNNSSTAENGNEHKNKTKCNSNPNSTSEDERTPIQICENTYVETPLSKTEISQVILNSEPKKMAKVKKPPSRSSAPSTLISSTPKRKKRVKESIETRRERKAWRTLAIITGTFVACWTPFFLVSLYRPICGCHIPPLLESITSWLGKELSLFSPSF